MSHIVLAKAWNNGKFLPNGGGYGVWLTNYFKDEYLDVEWSSVVLELEGWPKPAELAINTDAFWSRGRELRSGIIGKWLIGKPETSRKSSFAHWEATTLPPPSPRWTVCRTAWMSSLQPHRP